MQEYSITSNIDHKILVLYKIDYPQVPYQSNLMNDGILNIFVLMIWKNKNFSKDATVPYGQLSLANTPIFIGQ